MLLLDFGEWLNLMRIVNNMVFDVLTNMCFTLVSVISTIAPDWELPLIVETSWQYFFEKAMVFNALFLYTLDDIVKAICIIFLFEMAIFGVRILGQIATLIRGGGKLG